MRFIMAISLFFVACHSKNENIQADKSNDLVSKPTQETVSYKAVDNVPKTQSTNLVEFSYDNNELLSRTDFECKVFVYEGTLVVQFLKDKEEINISFGGINIYKEKPYSGNFTLAPQENENTALMSIYVNDTLSGKQIKAPMCFDGKASIISFKEKEIRIEINALGGFFSDMENIAGWKPINGMLVAQNPVFSEMNNDIRKLFY